MEAEGPLFSGFFCLDCSLGTIGNLRKREFWILGEMFDG